MTIYYSKLFEDVVSSPTPPADPVKDQVWWNSATDDMSIWNGTAWIINTPPVVNDPTKAPLNSPALIGTPTTPTAVVGTNTAQIASTAFVKTAVDMGISAPSWNSITNKPSTFPPTLPIPSSGITGLDTTQAAQDAAIAGKAATIHIHAESDITNLIADLTARELTINKGAANGYAPLDSSSKVPSINLPSYVDDVLEFANLAAFPGTGIAGVIYIALDTNKTYRWGGSVYTEISPSPGSSDAVPEGSINLYYTTARSALNLLKAGDTMTGPLAMPMGSATATTLNFGTANTGIYATSTNNILFSSAGTLRFGVSNTQILAAVPISMITGTVAAVSAHFGTADTGFYGSSTAVATAIGGTVRHTVGASGLVVNGAITAQPTTTGAASIWAISADNHSALFLQKGVSGNQVYADIRTGVGAAGLRWRWTYSDATLEGGSDAGSNFALNAYSDAGGFLFSPFSVTRSTGLLTTRAITTTGTVTLSGTNTLNVGGVAHVGYNTALPAGGAATMLIKMSTSATGIYAGSGVPTVSAPKGSLYLRSDGASNSYTYVNTNGSTTWAPLLDSVSGGAEPPITIGTTAQYWRGDKSWQTLDKVAVGLDNVDNTSDANKPVSTAQATANALAVLKTGGTMTGPLTFSVATTAAPSFNLPTGAAPTTPIDGDFWVLNGQLAYRYLGTTYVQIATGHNQTMTGNKSFSTTTKFMSTTATPAGGTTGAGVSFGTSTNLGIYFGSGAPTLSAFQGSIYLRSDGAAGARTYVNTNGTTGWDTLADGTTDALKVAKAGDTMTGTLNIFPTTGVANLSIKSVDSHGGLFLDKGTVGSYAYIDGRFAGKNRWRIILGNSTAETGSNVGSDFSIGRYDDAGSVAIDNPLIISRGNGLVSLPLGATTTTKTVGDNTTAIATTAFVAAASALNVLKIGDTMTGQLNIIPTTGSAVFFAKSTDSNAAVIIEKGVATGSAYFEGRFANKIRWRNYLGEGTAEGGSNAGSNYIIARYDDAGTLIDTALTIYRSSGATVTKALAATSLSSTSVVVVSASSPAIYIDKVDGGVNSLTWRTGTVSRWAFSTNIASETGSNLGSNFVLTRYDDAGVVIDYPITINRNDGIVRMNTGAVTVTKTAGDNTTSVATTAFATTADLLRVLKAGDTMTGALIVQPASGTASITSKSASVHASMTIDKGASGSISYLDGAMGGLKRWRMMLGDSAVESTGNAGSNFYLQAYDDAGTTAIFNVMSASRVTGAANFIALGVTANINVGTSVSAGTTIRAHNATAVPAGGTTGAGFTFSVTPNLGVFFGSGAPTLTAAQGSLYVRTDGSSSSTRLYVNTTGAAVWVNFTSAS